MASSSWQKLLFIALTVAIAVPTSTCHRRRHHRPTRSDVDAEQNLRDLCSETDRFDVCVDIIKSNMQRFDNSDDRDIADGITDLARERAKAIRDQLNQWFRDSNDDNLKEKYRSCAQNYDDVDHNLEEAHRNLDSDDNQRISDQIDDAEEELEKCRQEFGDSFDPGHVGDRNNEIGVYLDMVRAASARLEDYSYDDEDHESD